MRGVVPQSLCPARAEDDVVLMFRPTAVFKDAAVSVLIDGEEVARKKHRILTPGEMVHMTLSKALLERLAEALACAGGSGAASGSGPCACTRVLTVEVVP